MPHSTWPFHSMALNMSSSVVWLRSPKTQWSIAQRDVAEVGQDLGVRHRLQVAAALDELLLADRVAAAVRVIEDDGRRPPGQAPRPRQVGRDGLDPVEVEVPRFEDVAVALFLAALLAADGPLAIGKVAEQRVELAAAGLDALLAGSRHRLTCERLGHERLRPERGAESPRESGRGWGPARIDK